MLINYKKSSIMKTTKFIFMLAIVAAFFTACKKDPMNEMPKITDIEVGSDNNKTAYPGTDIHIEADLLAAETITKVKLEINPVDPATGWKFEKEFTEGYAGNKNADFHEHIDIPADAALGKYRVVLTLIDAKGQVVKAESDLALKYDPTLPKATNFTVELEKGYELHVEAKINAVNKIAKVVVEIEGSNYEREFDYTDAAMVGTTSFDFHKHIDLTNAPKGHYHVHLKIVDQKNKENEFEDHFDKP